MIVRVLLAIVGGVVVGLLALSAFVFGFTYSVVGYTLNYGQVIWIDALVLIVFAILFAFTYEQADNESNPIKGRGMNDD